MANHPYNFYTNPGNLADTDVWAFSRVPHSGNTTFKTTPLNFQTYLTDAGFVTNATGLLKANNLSDVLNAPTSATNLGLGALSNVNFASLSLTGNASLGGTLTGVDVNLSGSLSGFSATFNAGKSGFNIVGSNPACNIGPNLNLGYASGGGQFFSNSLTGDVCLRQSSTSNVLRLGVGSASSAFDISNTQIIANLPISGVGLSGDVTGSNTASVVSLVGGSSASSVHSAELLANAATSANTANTIVLRNASGIFNASGASFSAGVSNFNITGSNQACNIGSNFNIGQASNNGAFFSGTVSGDCAIRQANTGLSIYMGLGSAGAQFVIQNTQILAGVGVKFPTSGGAAAALNYYEETTFNTNYTGSISGGPITLTIRRIGKLVMIFVPQFSGTAAGTLPISTVTAIPSRFLPASDTDFIYNGANGVNIIGGGNVIVSVGLLFWYAGPLLSNFTNALTATIYPHVISYIL